MRPGTGSPHLSSLLELLSLLFCAADVSDVRGWRAGGSTGEAEAWPRTALQEVRSVDEGAVTKASGGADVSTVHWLRMARATEGKCGEETGQAVAVGGGEKGPRHRAAAWILTHGFAQRVADEMSTEKRMGALRPLVEHACRGNPVATDGFVSALAGRLEREDVEYDALHPYFRVASVLIDMHDDTVGAAELRVASTMSALLLAVKAQKR